MKFSSILAVAFAAVPAFSAAVPAEASALEARAGSNNGAVIIAGAVDKADNATRYLDTAILTVKDPNNIDLNLLLDAAVFIVDTLVNQTKVVKKAPKLDEQCTDYVQWFVNRLIKDATKLGKDTIAAHSVFVAAGLDQALVSIVGEIQSDADTFADAIIAKVPPTRTALAKKDKAQIDAIFNKVIAAYPSST